MTKAMLKNVFLAVALFAVSSCSPKIEERGYIKNADWKENIIVGQTTKQDVLDKFGSPSAQSSFGTETWYYISSRKESNAFLKPETTDQEVTDIQFDTSGVVSAVNYYNKDDAKQIALVKRVTPTEGHTLGFIEQTLGNIGRFNKPTDGSSSGPRTPRAPMP